MKALTLIPIAALTLCTTFAYAGDNADTSTTASDSNAAMTSDAVGGTSVGSSGSGAFHGKTRAEVKQELQRAQQDGTLERALRRAVSRCTGLGYGARRTASRV
ncbi:hypothetical protein DLM46_31185 [Paraburkholderia lacunae]|uniref:DUF4148 domain-containing protein n=2 Tax=Paraburkholderia lacunae TaxID=2211104 RepID=A0A370MZZ5_9BURK|nr:DUF4148 domain-containing protein [Paraburkholderia lacunae]RDJ98941.1 hypothetical protein DLM46_31185 [Paraburkholderia lacunae]